MAASLPAAGPRPPHPVDGTRGRAGAPSGRTQSAGQCRAAEAALPCEAARSRTGDPRGILLPPPGPARKEASRQAEGDRIPASAGRLARQER